MIKDFFVAVGVISILLMLLSGGRCSIDIKSTPIQQKETSL